MLASEVQGNVMIFKMTHFVGWLAKITFFLLFECIKIKIERVFPDGKLLLTHIVQPDYVKSEVLIGKQGSVINKVRFYLAPLHNFVYKTV